MSSDSHNPNRILLLSSVFIVAASGLVYELIAAAISSYLLGDAVTQFSLVIGVFLSSMGVGSYLVQFIEKKLLFYFVCIELCIALIGGLSSLLMFATGAYFSDIFSVVFYIICILIGGMVGAEIPLLIRILKERERIENTLSNVLALDYIGALVGSLLFPMIILPYIGLSRASVIFGLMNLIVAWMGTSLLNPKEKRRVRIPAVGVGVVLCALFVYSNAMVRFFEDVLYQDEIVYTEETPYQRIVLTRWRDDIRLYLNGHIQFSSIDEARYHEPLVHTAIAALNAPVQKALILGGGDGMAARELLKYPSTKHIDLVDIDPAITALASSYPLLIKITGDALQDKRVHVHHTDGMLFLQEEQQTYDVIIIDLPDPNTSSLSKLYSTAFYALVLRKLNDGGVFITQASSPYYAPDAFWCIFNTIEATHKESELGYDGFTIPLHANVPSFGEWGFVMSGKRSIDTSDILLPSDISFRFLNKDIFPSLFQFGNDIRQRETKINRLTDPVLHQYYQKGWTQYH
jgi:spermidine synthase